MEKSFAEALRCQLESRLREQFSVELAVKVAEARTAAREDVLQGLISEEDLADIREEVERKIEEEIYSELWEDEAFINTTRKKAYDAIWKEFYGNGEHLLTGSGSLYERVKADLREELRPILKSELEQELATAWGLNTEA